jgi:hypothetical protein
MTAPVNAPAPSPATAAPAGRAPELALGALLIVIGLIMAGAWFFPEADGYAPLVVGLVLLALFAATRQYGFAVAGGIVTGVGVGVWLTTETTLDGGWFLLALAAGFASIWPLGYLAKPALRNLWPFIPATILAAVGLMSVTDTELEAPLGQFLVAGALVLLGFGLILRSRGASDSPDGSGATGA